MSVASAMLAPAAILDGPVTNSANGHVYYLLTQANWTQSEAEAVRLGGHLVTINDQAENDWVFQRFSSFGGVSRALWIGLADKQTEGTFVWASGEDSTFTLWGPGQPDNGAPPPENFVHMLWPGHSSAGHWNDAYDSDSVIGFVLNGVVEVIQFGEPGLSIRVSEVELCWFSRTNKTYQIQYRSELTTNAWTDLGTPIAGSDTSHCTTDAIIGPRRFYRLIVQP